MIQSAALVGSTVVATSGHSTARWLAREDAPNVGNATVGAPGGKIPDALLALEVATGRTIGVTRLDRHYWLAQGR
jgi:hypothetical protein